MTKPKLTFGDAEAAEYAKLKPLLDLRVAEWHVCDCRHCYESPRYLCPYCQGDDLDEDEEDKRFMGCDCLRGGVIWKFHFERNHARSFCAKYEVEAKSKL